MHQFEIREQVKLSFGKCVELVLNGVQFRLFRASITVAIVSLAVAFLMAILGDGLIGRQVAEAIHEVTLPRRTFLRWVDRLSSPMTESVLSATLLGAKRGDDRWEELKKWGNCTDEELLALRENAQQEAVYLKFFAGLKESQLRRIVGRARARAAFAALQEPADREKLRREYPALGVRFPTSFEQFERFLDGWAVLSEPRRRIIAGHAEAVEKATALLGGRPVYTALADMDAAFREQLLGLGFRFSDNELAMVVAEARSVEAVRRLEVLLGNTAFKQRFAIEYGVKDINMVSSAILFRKSVSASGARWLLRTVRELGLPFDYGVEEVCRISHRQVEAERLAEMETAVAAMGPRSGLMGLSPRVVWLILVSLVVCMVGITNAMLMSVTERFKEIATMKCLGATDGFIMINFLLESGLQGVAGGVIGGVLGFALGIARSTMTYGLMAAQNIPFLIFLAIFFVCLGIGIVLSIVAAIYPAWVAARLAPMEAMRVE